VDYWRAGVRRKCNIQPLFETMQLLIYSSVVLLWAGSAVGTLLVGSIILYFGNLIDRYDKEAIISYEITAPNPPDDGTVLEKPSIKARNPQTSF
jgi:hypothetical protein